jgi:hypothetical protein
MTFRLPNSKQRIALLGCTGSGKTLGGLFHLSNANFDAMPWTIIDFKKDEHIEAIPRAQYVTPNDTPKHPGIYILQPAPKEDISGYLTRVWRKGSHGVFVDEGFVMSSVPANENMFEVLMTQGRSLRIPMIMLSQRPAWVSRFMFSEADYIQTWRLNDKRDIKTVESFLPQDAYKRLPDFHSLYYDVGKNKLTYLKPVPDEAETLQKIEDRLKPIRRAV